MDTRERIPDLFAPPAEWRYRRKPRKPPEPVICPPGISLWAEVGGELFPLVIYEIRRQFLGRSRRIVLANNAAGTTVGEHAAIIIKTRHADDVAVLVSELRESGYVNLTIDTKHRIDDPPPPRMAESEPVPF